MRLHIKGKIDTINIRTGHKSHKSGAGIHKNNKDKRLQNKIKEILNPNES